MNISKMADFGAFPGRAMSLYVPLSKGTHHRSDMALDDLARKYNPYIRGWINYYSHFYKSALAWTLRRVDAFLIRWARNKFKRLRLRPRGAREWFSRVVRGNPNLFAHWGFLHVSDRTSGAV